MRKQKAVSLHYPENYPAPFISASAKGALAERMVAIAEASGIPVIKDESLVEILSAAQVGECIPEAAYEVVSKVFAFILEQGVSQ
jgi:flagellar biosynthesis protein